MISKTFKCIINTKTLLKWSGEGGKNITKQFVFSPNHRNTLSHSLPVCWVTSYTQLLQHQPHHCRTVGWWQRSKPEAREEDLFIHINPFLLGLSSLVGGKEPTCQSGDTRDAGSIPGSGTSPGDRNGNPLQYSCLENSMDRGAWRATVHGVTKSQTQLSCLLFCYLHHSYLVQVSQQVLGLEEWGKKKMTPW